MPSLKGKELKEMGKTERSRKLEELKLELIKAKSQSNKGGSSRIKEIKKIIARIYTLDKKIEDKKPMEKTTLNESKKTPSNKGSTKKVEKKT